MLKRHVLASFFVLGACVGDGGSVPSGGTDGTTTTGAGADGLGDVCQADETGLPPEGAFLVPVDFGGPTFECDPWRERSPLAPSDCPAGEKCTPWADDAGPSWNATRCVPLDGSPAAIGDPCATDFPGTTGLDDCEQGSACLNVGATGVGVCAAFCEMDSFEVVPGNDLACPSGTTCAVANGGVLPICLAECHPLDAGSCATGEGCFPLHHGFVCTQPSGPPASPDPGTLGEACEFVNDCDDGLFCLESALLSSCSGDRCCAAFCDIATTSCAAPGTECLPWYEEGTSLESNWEDLGFCGTTLVAWTPGLHISELSDGSFVISPSYYNYIQNNPLVGIADSVGDVRTDGCFELELVGSLALALGLQDGDQPLRLNGSSLDDDDGLDTVVRAAAGTEFVLEVESPEPAAWFVRPRVLRYEVQ